MTALVPDGKRAIIGVEGARFYQVQFNPSTLVYEFTNTLKEEGKGEQRAQYTTQTSAKLSIDLIFDTTDRGISVTDGTRKVLKMAKPVSVTKHKETREVPPVVTIRWGEFRFKGVIESYKETIDFFSNEGVPLRATLNLKLSEKTSEFGKKNANLGRGSLASDGLDLEDAPPDTVDVPPGTNGNMQDQANLAGDPGAAREMAEASGVEDIRAPLEDGAAVSSKSAPLSPPAAFAKGGASADGSAGFAAAAGASAGFAASADAGFSAGASAGFSAGASPGFSAGASASFSADASASFGASAGAAFETGISTEARFAGLRTTIATTSIALDPVRLLPPLPSAAVSVDANASFTLGGKALVEGNSSFRADVGTGVSWSAGGFVSASGKIRFEE